MIIEAVAPQGPGCLVRWMQRTNLMDKYDVCASVLLDAVRNAEVKLADYCDIYSRVGREAATLLGHYGTVSRTSLGSCATSKLGTPLVSPTGASVLAVRITVRINEEGRAITEGKTKDQLVEALRQADSPR